MKKKTTKVKPKKKTTKAKNRITSETASRYLGDTLSAIGPAISTKDSRIRAIELIINAATTTRHCPTPRIHWRVIRV